MPLKCKVLSCECCNVYLPQRWLGAVLSTLTIIAAYCMRVSTHLAIVRMVKNTTKAVSKSNCVPPKDIGKKKTSYGENDWSQNIQGWIISGFYIGYLPFHFPAGALADKFGSRWILSTGILVCIVCTFLIPISTDYIGYIAVIILRIIQGAGQGVVFPAITAFLGRWAPKEERSLASSISFAGTPIGSVVGILLTGILMVYFDNWRAPFYFWGTFSFIIYVLLVLYLYSEPKSHPNITEKEADFLMDRIPSKNKQRIPYATIILDGAVLATIVAQIGHVAILFFFANSMPKYMDNVLRYPVTNNALISSLPYLGLLAVSVTSGELADWGIKKKKWDIGCTRKVYTFVANAWPGFFVLAVGYCGCNNTLVIIMFVLSMVTMGPYHPGMKANTLDLTTQYAGFAMALSNGLGAIMGALCPPLFAFMAPNNTLEEWIIIFWVLCAISTITTIMYIFMASGKRRRWDYPTEDQKYFVGRVPWFSLLDGKDKDKMAVEAGRAADVEANLDSAVEKK